VVVGADRPPATSLVQPLRAISEEIEARHTTRRNMGRCVMDKRRRDATAAMLGRNIDTRQPRRKVALAWRRAVDLCRLLDDARRSNRQITIQRDEGIGDRVRAGCLLLQAGGQTVERTVRLDVTPLVKQPLGHDRYQFRTLPDRQYPHAQHLPDAERAN
jgi:hypothetical protein